MQEIEKSISFDGRDIKLRVGLLAPRLEGLCWCNREKPPFW